MEMAKNLDYQRLESSLNLGLFMDFAHKTLSQPLTSSESEHSDFEATASGGKWKNGLKTTRQERRNDKCHVYNFSQIGMDRKWLQDVILSDSDDTDTDFSDEDRYIKSMLKQHVKEKRFRERFHKIPNNSQFAYYGSGLLSNEDTFPENSANLGVKRKRKEREKKFKPLKDKLPKKPIKFLPFDNIEPGEIDPNEIDWDDSNNIDLEEEVDLDMGLSLTGNNRGRKRKSLLPQTPEIMTSRRRKIWQLMAKKEIGKVQRARTNNHKEMLQNAKRMATMCMRVQRQKAIQSQKLMKDSVWRAKRLTREMLGYWKRYDRVEREQRRQMEKEAEEQRKRDVELIEVKRQQRKLNFLITQTELYAHFMSKKLGQGSEEEQLRILNQLDEDVNPRLTAYDDYDAEELKEMAQKNAQNAFTTDRQRTQQFNVVGEEVIKMEPMNELQELPQPDIFQGTLKAYQLKGMTWLANLYDQGISGILADEMGLGKTVQSIAFLCHIAERYGVWGPFLIVSPASTLHNWQQEMAKFVPSFNVVPYWGSPSERKILRQFWEQKDLHTKQASFHVVITSYQLIVSDYKYFNRIKWQYMVLDEAQAIKSSSSQRWKLLLGFNCRNRLLLSGTPIQNSMAELWALLHFIMPTLFDSHDEFNEWFSKDIESHAENKTGIDEKQISRLHMILKPFMLRRIKKDVENELSDKIEIMVYCPLTTRQKLLYIALKKKIKVEDLLHLTGGGGVVDKNFTSNLMNLVMQFRKVCNHPELFERRDARSPFAMRECCEYVIPKLIYQEGFLSNSIPSKKHILYNRFSIFKSHNVQKNPCFSFSRFIDTSVQEVERTTIGGLIELLKHLIKLNQFYKLLSYRRQWNWDFNTRFMLLEPTLENPLNKRFLPEESVLRKLLFTSISGSLVYSHGAFETTNIQETIEHRVIRSKGKDISPVKMEVEIKEEPEIENDPIAKNTSPMRGRPPKNFDKSQTTVQINLVPEFPHKYRPTQRYTTEPLHAPKFLMDLVPRVQAKARRLYCESRSAEWDYIRHMSCENLEGKEIVYNGLDKCHPERGWSSISIPDKQALVSDAGKLSVLDSLLTRLKSQGHRVLIYSQMTRMIDLLEEYMWHRKHRYMRLDGSSKISERRDMVADFQNRSDIFVFLLSTRAGGLGINLTAADTVIFYDSDWNPTVDQQAMDRAHRLGQTKQVTVYRLICKGTIEERILQRAREKSEIQRMVISGGNFKPDTLKPKEVVSLLLDDEEIEMKYQQRTNDISSGVGPEKRKTFNNDSCKKQKLDGEDSPDMISTVSSPSQSEKYEPFVPGATAINEDSENDIYGDCDSPMVSMFSQYDIEKPRRRHNPRGTKRGRPRGIRRGGGNGVLGRTDLVGSTPSTSSIGSNSSATFSGDANSSPAIVKRGPGRPRLKPGGPPSNHSIRGTGGFRGISRPRKPMGPLVVPLGQHCSPAVTPVNNRSPAMSPEASPIQSDKHSDITN